MPHVELARSVAVDTAERLGRMPPPVEALGWVSWAEEAAAALCHRLSLRPDANPKHRHHNPCGACRREMREFLRAHS